jgi:hypothetical protein
MNYYANKLLFMLPSIYASHLASTTAYSRPLIDNRFIDNYVLHNRRQKKTVLCSFKKEPRDGSSETGSLRLISMSW